MHIETKRLLIRDFCPEDAQALHAILGDGEAMKYLEQPYDFEKTVDFLHSFCIARGGAFAACLRDSGTLTGYILFKEFEPGVFEIGWIINRDFWRQGYAFEACRAIIDHAFDELGARKIFAETVDTERSPGLIKKLGMSFDGRQGAMFIYSLLKDPYSLGKNK